MTRPSYVRRPLKHGYRGYAGGCRCDTCSSAWDAAEQAQQAASARSRVRALLYERYGPAGAGLLREAVAKPPPKPIATPQEAAVHRRRLVDAMQMGTGTYGRRRRS